MACTRPTALASSASPSSDAITRVAVGPLPGPEKLLPMPSNPFAENRAAIGDGHRYFNQFNCAGCHGDHGGGGMGPSLRDERWIYGNEDAQVFSSIAEGRANGMPAWGTKLNSEQLWKLVAYIKTLRTPLEAEPPN
jgi:cytochrome c oxidase cbb3-type subunit 3